MKAVAKSPLKVKFSGRHSKFILSQREPGPLRLLPNVGNRVQAWFLCVSGGSLLILALIAVMMLICGQTFKGYDPFEQCIVTFILLVFGVLLSFVGIESHGRRFAFDFRTGEMTRRHFWRTRRWPLTNIVAVQVLNGGVFGSGAKRVISYQLNLVLDVPNEPRLFLAYNRDEADMLAKSKVLADFLHVPLLVESQSDQGGRPAAPRTPSYKIQRDVTVDKRMLTACLLFGGAMLSTIATGTRDAIFPRIPGGEAPRLLGLALIISLLCLFASIVNLFIAYAQLCWYYRCPKCGERLKRTSSELGSICYPCNSCKIFWNTGWESDIAD